MYEPIIQFSMYAIAGGIATAFGIVLFHLFGWKLLPCLQEDDHLVRVLGLEVKDVDNAIRSRNSMLCNALAFVFSNFVAYMANRLWVFEPGRHHIALEILYFYAVSGISVVLGTVLMGFLIKKFGMLTTYAYGSNILTAVLINFVVRKYLIFSG